MIFAYYLDGPADLTKQVIKGDKAPHVLEWAVMAPMSPYRAPQATIRCRIARYRLVESQPLLGRPDDVAVYLFDGYRE